MYEGETEKAKEKKKSHRITLELQIKTHIFVKIPKHLAMLNFSF